MVRVQLRSRGIRDPGTLTAMGLVPREAFVPPSHRDRAYEDGALAIGRGQTISQPYIVARMTEALGLTSLDEPGVSPPRVLDVGTGSGYQAAILARMGAHVVSIERDADLAVEARARLHELGYDVEVILGDGSQGYAAGAPFAGIVVGAAAPSVPAPLAAQLSDGARLVVPVGSRDAQRLIVVQRLGAGFERHALDACVFVPLVGLHGHAG